MSEVESFPSEYVFNCYPGRKKSQICSILQQFFKRIIAFGERFKYDELGDDERRVSAGKTIVIIVAFICTYR